MKRLPYEEGTWFAVPLRDRGFGVGVVARIGRRGVTLGYFFGPRRDAVPRVNEVENLRPDDAIVVKLFGDLGLIEGSWPIIGRGTQWNRSDWPLPGFRRLDDFTGQARRVEYSEKDLVTAVRDVPTTREDVNGLPEDGLSGAGAVEIVLTRVLNEGRIRWDGVRRPAQGKGPQRL